MTELKDKDKQYSELLKYKKISSDKKNVIILALRAVFVTFFVVTATIFAMHIITNYDDISAIMGSFTDKKLFGVEVSSKPDLTPSRFNFKMLSRYQNILVLGVDSNGPNTLPYSGVRSDTIMIVNVDNYGKSINAISIPRDSKVYISDGHGIQKINSAYATGGIELTKKTIEETLGIKIHNYIVINSEGLKKLIDTIGGVPIYIEQDMRYHDYTAKLHINFKKGDYVLNGEDAEGYLRYRKDMLGDIGRVHRQQKFINALIEKLKTPDSIKKIPDALRIANLYTRTDLNLYQMSQYASLLKDLDLNKVEFVMLPGSPNKKGIISYWILDPDKTQQVINRLIYRKKTEPGHKDISIGIIYSNMNESEAFSLRDELKTSGYDVNCMGRSKKINQSQIIGYNTSVSNGLIKEIQNKIPLIAQYGYVHKSVRSFCDASDIVITISKD